METLKNRVNSFGLAQAIVRPIGDKDVLVEIPRADDKVITNVKRILQEQGKFEGIIAGKVAVSGENVVAVGGPNGEATPATTATNQWSLSFTVTRHGADLFAQAAKGKAQYPVYMFLDRPENAVVIADKNEVYYYGYLADLTDPDKSVNQLIENTGFSLATIANFQGVGFIYAYEKKDFD